MVKHTREQWKSAQVKFINCVDGDIKHLFLFFVQMIEK